MSQPDTAARRLVYQEEKAALQALLDLDERDRGEALAELTRTRPGLAARLRRRLELSVAPVPVPGGEADAPPVIPRYRIERELGRGGMGRVWLAVRADGADGQQLAIKQIRADAFDEHALRRFEAERRALARLDHPNIVALLDAGSDAAGQPYLVTSFVEGMPIQQYCALHATSLRARVALLRAVASALAHAHQQLIVHRDLKPANVLVDQQGRVRLLDFGIAKMLDVDTEATAAGASLMTLRYAAPEQLAGGGAGTACDLYSLGVLAYELLSGRSPYGELREPAALIRAITQGEPAPLPRSGAARVPDDLAAIIMKLLRKRPEHRYRSADAVLEEFDRWSRGALVEAMRGRRAYQARAWLKRYWIALAVVSTAIAMLAVHTVRMDRQLRLTEHERDRATEVSEFLITLFQSARPADTKTGSISALELLKLGADRLLGDEGESLTPEGRAALMFSTGHSFYQMDDQDSALRLFSTAADLYAASPTTPVATLSEALRFKAMALYAKGDYEAALTVVQQAGAALRAAGDARSDELGSVLNAQCVYLGSLVRVDEARACYRSLMDFHIERRTPAIERVSAMSNIAGFEIAQGEPERAERMLREAIALLPDSDAFGYGQALPIHLKGQLAASLREQERFDESAALYTEAIAEARRYDGKDARPLTVHDVGLASSLTLAGRVAEAEAPIREALRLAAGIYGPSQKNALNVRLEYARWLLAGGRIAQARDELLQIQALRAQQVPVDQAGDALAGVTLAYVRCREEASGARLAELDNAIMIVRQPGISTRLRLQQALAWREDCAAAAGGPAERVL